MILEFAIDVVAFMAGLAIYDWLKGRSGRRRRGKARVSETPSEDPRT